MWEQQSCMIYCMLIKPKAFRLALWSQACHCARNMSLMARLWQALSHGCFGHTWAHTHTHTILSVSIHTPSCKRQQTSVEVLAVQQGMCEVWERHCWGGRRKTHIHTHSHTVWIYTVNFIPGVITWSPTSCCLALFNDSSALADVNQLESSKEMTFNRFINSSTDIFTGSVFGPGLNCS